jgi:transposase
MATDGGVTIATLTDQLARLRQENELLRAEREQWLEDKKSSARTIEQLQHQLQQLLRRLFGRSAEKVDPKQMLLFETLLNQLAPPTPTPPPEPAPVASHPSTNGHGRRRLPSDLPRQKIVHDLPESEKPCPCCGQMRHVIGQEISEQLDYVPAELTVIEHVRLKYACRDCEQNAAEGGPQIITAEKPLSPIEKGLAAPGLLSYLIVSKYGDHLPLYRLEKILDRHGIEIARSTTCGWMAQCAAVLKPLYDLMTTRVLQSKVIHTDDTPVEVLDPGRGQTRTGRFWVYLGDGDHPYTIFTYTASRSRDGPMQFLKGWGRDRRVYLQADAFGGYDGIYAGEAGGQVTEVACWAHARRKFYEARTSNAEGSTKALAYIRLLYDVEDQAREQFEQARKAGAQRQDPAAAPPREPGADGHARGTMSRRAGIRHALRQEFSIPRLEQFKTWLQSQQAASGPGAPGVLPKSPMGQAITYALNQWEALCTYTTDGDLAIDNNAAENALRRAALGRKNWLFCGSDNGGNTAAILYTFIATCQRSRRAGLEPFAYLRDVLTRIAATPLSQLDQWLPDRWPPAVQPANPN